jgi:hypothetical protein
MIFLSAQSHLEISLLKFKALTLGVDGQPYDHSNELQNMLKFKTLTLGEDGQPDDHSRKL